VAQQGFKEGNREIKHITLPPTRVLPMGLNVGAIGSIWLFSFGSRKELF